jgi:uncharacterized protein (DUF1800 family)
MRPVPEHFLLGRLAFGLGPEDERTHLRDVGLQTWLLEQLAPPEGDDAKTLERLNQTRIPIRYEAGKPPGIEYPAVDENRPLETLSAPIEELWRRTSATYPKAGQERSRPRTEVAAACLVRAVYSHWQLREVLCDFWHNHFNVDASQLPQVSIALPVYDREVIRRHALGNFRDFLEAVASSTAMLYYLNNQSSRAGSPNENYARELFELHSLGREHYFNDLYNRWRDVPGATIGHPKGFIDQDVYEAARAFTGWAVEDGSTIMGTDKLHATGRFAYVDSWHDNYQKRVLGVEFTPYQAPLADGRKVLDLIADHPAVARHLCAKLCRRLVGESASSKLINAATELWSKNRKQSDQIARVVKFIALSTEFANSQGARVRRPLELAAAFARATHLDFTPSERLINEIARAGQRLFAWGAPTGHPEEPAYWLSSNSMRHRWQLVQALADNRFGNGDINPATALNPASRTFAQAADDWSAQLLGTPSGSATSKVILAGLNLDPARQMDLNNVRDRDRLLRRIISFIAMSPEFQRA